MSLGFPYTNECLDTIVKGLDVNPSDDIIAICGSGDQAFAMLEYANSVLAVDNDKEQVEYAMRRAEALKAGDIEKFLRPVPESCLDLIMVGSDMKRSIAYFSQPGRLERIRNNLGRLDIKHVNDFLDEVGKNKFSKAYLSNILGYNPSTAKPEGRIAYLEKAAAGLREPGLIYMSNCHSYLLDSISDANVITNAKELTASAKATEAKGDASMLWLPAVLRSRTWS